MKTLIITLIAISVYMPAYTAHSNIALVVLLSINMVSYYVDVFKYIIGLLYIDFKKNLDVYTYDVLLAPFLYTTSCILLYMHGWYFFSGLLVPMTVMLFTLNIFVLLIKHGYLDINDKNKG